jgi:hypothetical protein
MSVRKLDVLYQANIDGFVKNTEKASKSVEKFAKDAHKHGESAGLGEALEVGMNPIEKILGAAGLAGIAAFVDKSLEAVNAIGKLSDKTGVAVETISGLEYGAIEAGLGVDVMHEGILHMTQGLGKLEDDGGKAGKALASIGVVTGDMMQAGPDEMLMRIADALHKTEDPWRRNAAAADIFGREAGPKLAGLLGKGRQALKDLTKEALAAGFPTLKDYMQAHAAEEAMNKLKATVMGLGMHLAVELAPSLERAADALSSFFHGAEATDKMADDMDRIGKSSDDLGDSMEAVGRTFNLCASLIHGLMTSLYAVAFTFMDILAKVTHFQTGGWETFYKEAAKNYDKKAGEAWAATKDQFAKTWEEKKKKWEEKKKKEAAPPKAPGQPSSMPVNSKRPTAGAALWGSREAYSAILQAELGKEDPAVAQAKKGVALLQQIRDNTNPDAAEAPQEINMV